MVRIGCVAKVSSGMRTPEILALIAFRDEERQLPGFFAHLRDYVDGFVGFNDCSRDGSMAIAGAEPKMLDLMERQVPSEDHFFESENRAELLASARKHGARWVLCCDADERFETRFLENLRELVHNPPAQVMGLSVVAVWENLSQCRVGKSFKHVLFPSVEPRPYYPPGRLHEPWYPRSLAGATKQVLDYRIYHLGSMTRKDRLERYAKFSRIDPGLRFQPQGYKSLIDETNVVLEPIAPERSFRCG